MQNITVIQLKHNLITIQFIKSNLYQIFTYVKNRDYDFKEEEHKVSGMFYMQKQMKKYNLIMYIKCMETRLPLRH